MVEVAAGDRHTVARLADGELRAFGRGISVPVKVTVLPSGLPFAVALPLTAALPLPFAAAVPL